MYTTYAIASTIKKYVYIGHTNNLERRLTEHNTGHTPSNRKYAPFKIVYQRSFDTRNEAIAHEKNLKKGYNRERLSKTAYGGMAEWFKATVC